MLYKTLLVSIGIDPDLVAELLAGIAHHVVQFKLRETCASRKSELLDIRSNSARSGQRV
jgi:hypothetical protein